MDEFDDYTDGTGDDGDEDGSGFSSGSGEGDGTGFGRGVLQGDEMTMTDIGSGTEFFDGYG